MGLRTYLGTTFLTAALLISGSDAVMASDVSQYGPPTRERMPSSSRCTAECNAMEVKCEELEKLFPACGVADVCIEEKETCMAKCRFSAKLCPVGSGADKASG